jgi:hypothetical protein
LTSEIPEGRSDQEKAYLARLARPMPLRVQRELDVCIDMDQFHAALDGTRAVLNAVLTRPAEMSPYASPAALQAGWKDSLAELQVSFEKTDQLGQALIRSIKVMLALE